MQEHEVTTLLYLVDERSDRILLGAKKDDTIKLGTKRFTGAAAKLNGYGGKMRADDANILAAGMREFQEETGARMLDPELIGLALFYNPGVTTSCYVYLGSRWEGEPSEQKEMTVEWHPRTPLPLDRMWDGDRLWLPAMLSHPGMVVHVEYGNVSIGFPLRVDMHFGIPLHEGMHTALRMR